MTRKRVEQLLARLEPRIRRKYRQVLQRTRDKWTIAHLEAALEGGTVSDVLDDMERAAGVFAAQTEAVTALVAQEVAGQLAAKLDKLVSYDGTNVRAVEQLRANRLRLVQGLREEARENITDILAEHTAEGINPRQQAAAIRDSLGLTGEQSKWVRSYRRRLESLDRGALGMELRDARHDGTVLRAIEQGKPLSAKQLDKMVTRYAERALAYRAEVVARTECLRAVHLGAQEGYQQGIDGGSLDAAALVCTWHAGSAPRTRESHIAMRGQRRPWGETFLSGHGYALLYPCDPNAPASEVANCRCSRSVKAYPDAESATAALTAPT